MYHANVNVDLMEEIVIQINGGIMTIADVSVKHIIYVKKVIFGILVHAFVICLATIMYDSVIICDEIIKQAAQKILLKIKQPVKCKINLFYLHFC